MCGLFLNCKTISVGEKGSFWVLLSQGITTFTYCETILINFFNSASVKHKQRTTFVAKSIDGISSTPKMPPFRPKSDSHFEELLSLSAEENESVPHAAANDRYQMQFYKAFRSTADGGGICQSFEHF